MLSAVSGKAFMKIKIKIEALKTIRILSGSSQLEIAKKAGISSGFYSQIENDIRSPSPQVAKKLCQIYKVRFDDIFFIEKTKAS